MESESLSQDGAAAVASTSSTCADSAEPLGSVTQPTDCEGGVQLRTSARVSKKLKLDSLAHSTVERKDFCNHEEEKKAEVQVNTEVKPRAKRVDWSTEDKFAFFEALNEYGKDIDAIHNYLVQKAKRRGGVETKTKDQVRFFYYRMWSILSKHINFPSYIKKQTQELYALINFGELRKKVSLSNKKHYEKLSEMIYSGATQLKFRGKVRKIRTPLCRALRKLNHIEESSEELRLPSVVSVELRPRSTQDWCRVQTLAQNPRVRTVLPLQRRLETLISYLHRRWQPQDHKLKEQLLSSSGGDEERVGGGEEGEGWVLHLGPKPGTHATQATVRLSEVATSNKLSLLAYEQRFHPQAKEVPTLLDQLPMIHRAKGRGVKRARADSGSERAGGKEGEEGGGEVVVGEVAAGGPSADVIETAVGQLLTLHCITDNAQPDALSPHHNGEMVSPLKESAEPQINQDTSWNLSTVGALRIGDIYMKCGVDAKIQLDYWWERVKAADPGSCSPAHPPHPEPDTHPAPVPAAVTLASTLQKLLSVANLDKLRAKGTTSTTTGSEAKVLNSKPRPLKPKPAQDVIKQPDTQHKFQVCPLPLDEVFRRPLIAPISPSTKTSNPHDLGFEKMRPRFCNRKGRMKRPALVKSVHLAPLLPKVPPPLPSVPVSLFTNTKKGFKPIAPKPTDTTLSPITIDVRVAPVTGTAGVKVETKTEAKVETDVNAQVPSPPSLSNLLDDLSLPSSIHSNRSSRLNTPVPTFEGLLDNSNANMTSLSTPVKDQWISSEVADLSLSGFSFLNNLDTDIRNIDDSRLSDVDSQLRHFMNTDNTADLNEIIADLTNTIKTDTQPH